MDKHIVYGVYRLCEQQRLRRACSYLQQALFPMMKSDWTIKAYGRLLCCSNKRFDYDSMLEFKYRYGSAIKDLAPSL